LAKAHGSRKRKALPAKTSVTASGCSSSASTPRGAVSADPRLKYAQIFCDALNNFVKKDFEALVWTHCSRDVCLVFESFGTKTNSSEPKYMEIRGQYTITLYWERVLQATPDSVFKIYAVRLKQLPEGCTSVNCRFSFSGTRLYLLSCIDEYADQQVVFSPVMQNVNADGEVGNVNNYACCCIICKSTLRSAFGSSGSSSSSSSGSGGSSGVQEVAIGGGSCWRDITHICETVFSDAGALQDSYVSGVSPVPGGSSYGSDAARLVPIAAAFSPVFTASQNNVQVDEEPPPKKTTLGTITYFINADKRVYKIHVAHTLKLK
jgi:hypothetical protein